MLTVYSNVYSCLIAFSHDEKPLHHLTDASFMPFDDVDEKKFWQSALYIGNGQR